MKKICLIRHGETEWNKLSIIQGNTDIPLNDTGKSQAKVIGEYISSCKWDAIVSIHLKRANQTADIISDTLNIHSITVDKNLAERNYGKVEGMKSEEVRIKYPDRNYEGAEQWDSFKNRVFLSVLHQAKTINANNIIIVSHGGSINSVLHILSEGKIGSGITKLNNCCINMLNFDGKRFAIEYFNKNILES